MQVRAPGPLLRVDITLTDAGRMTRLTSGAPQPTRTHADVKAHGHAKPCSHAELGVFGLAAPAPADSGSRRNRWQSSLYSLGSPLSVLNAGILENTSATKSMNTIARFGRSLFAT